MSLLVYTDNMAGVLFGNICVVFGIFLLHLVSCAPTKRQGIDCERCEDEAHGFASLNGGTYGGRGGSVVVATTHGELKTYAGSDEPLIIRVDGEIVSEPLGYEIPIASNKTIIGMNATAHLIGGGFTIKQQSNIILRNLEISDTRIPEDWAGKTEDWDGIQVDTGTNIWIDHVKVSEHFKILKAQPASSN